MTKHPEAKRAVELIDLLFEIDRKATDLQHLNKLRASESKAVIAEFDAYLESRRGKFLESMAFGKAVTYYDEHKEALHQFLNHSVVPLDNNTAERALRAPVMGRNNFQGLRSIDGAGSQFGSGGNLPASTNSLRQLNSTFAAMSTSRLYAPVPTPVLSAKGSVE